MRPAVLPSLLLLLVGSAAYTQLSLLPQVGFEQSHTSLNYNGQGNFSPLGGQGAPKATVRLDYRIKGGHGPFVGVGTSPGAVAFNFTDPATALNSYTATSENLQVRLEGGYQYSSKPIYFKKSSKSSTAKVSEAPTVKSSCGSYIYRSHCGHSKTSSAAKKADTRWNMRIQPSLGAAFIPWTKDNIVTSQAGAAPSHTYNAGNWNTALLAGTGFEFGKGMDRMFTLSFYYLKGLGNLDNQTLVTEIDSKTTTTNLKSDMSSWSVTLGLPFTLSKKKAVVQQTKVEQKSTEHKSKCGQQYYRYRCSRKIVI